MRGRIDNIEMAEGFCRMRVSNIEMAEGFGLFCCGIPGFVPIVQDFFGFSLQVILSRFGPARTRLECVVVATRTHQTHQNRHFFILVSLVILVFKRKDRSCPDGEARR